MTISNLINASLQVALSQQGMAARPVHPLDLPIGKWEKLFAHFAA